MSDEAELQMRRALQDVRDVVERSRGPLESRAERAERFARAWKALAKDACKACDAYRRMLKRCAGTCEGSREERARILELVRGLMCPPGNEDCDMCIAYRAVITTIEANP